MKQFKSDDVVFGLQHVEFQIVENEIWTYQLVAHLLTFNDVINCQMIFKKMQTNVNRKTKIKNALTDLSQNTSWCTAQIKYQHLNKCSKCDAVLVCCSSGGHFPVLVPCISAFGSPFALPFLAFLRRHFQFRGFLNPENFFFFGGGGVGWVALWRSMCWTHWCYLGGGVVFSCFWLFWCFFKFSVFRLFGGARCAISIAPHRVVLRVSFRLCPFSKEVVRVPSKTMWLFCGVVLFKKWFQFLYLLLFFCGFLSLVSYTRNTECIDHVRYQRQQRQTSIPNIPQCVSPNHRLKRLNAKPQQQLSKRKPTTININRIRQTAQTTEHKKTPEEASRQRNRLDKNEIWIN